MYNACNLLGYRSYHTLEAFNNGLHDMKILNEALESGLYRDRGSPFTRKEFDKWFKNYDVCSLFDEWHDGRIQSDTTMQVITEMPCYMPQQFVSAYPDAQYLLVERNPDDLVRSWEATTFQFEDALNSLPLSLLKYFDPMLLQINRFCKAILTAVTDGKGTTVEGRAALRQYYID